MENNYNRNSELVQVIRKNTCFNFFSVTYLIAKAFHYWTGIADSINTLISGESCLSSAIKEEHELLTQDFACTLRCEDVPEFNS